MTLKSCHLCFLFLTLSFFLKAQGPRLSEERVVLHTVAGDLVLVLYPEVAPQHVSQILTLARLGAYDTTHFFRVMPGFVLQTSTVHHRLVPLSSQQQEALRKIPAEFSDLKHQYGVLSMAREDGDPDSAESSFSILLGPAPHLDGRYTIFGRIEAGLSVLEEMTRVPVDRNHSPRVRLTINKVSVVPNREALTSMKLQEAIPLVSSESSPVEAPLEGPLTQSKSFFAVAIGLMIGISLIGFFLSGYLPQALLVSLNLINVLIGAFSLFSVGVPLGQKDPRFAVIIFIGLLALFKLMNRFEKGRF